MIRSSETRAISSAYWAYKMALDMMRLYPEYTFQLWVSDPNVEEYHEQFFQGCHFRFFPWSKQRDCLLEELLALDSTIVHHHSCTNHASYASSVLAAAASKHAIVQTFHQEFVKNHDYRDVALEHTDIVFHCSNKNTDAPRRVAKGDLLQTTVGIDFDKFSPSSQRKARSHIGNVESEPLLLSVSRLTHDKYIKSIIHALAKLQHLDWRYIIVGAGPMEAELRKKAHALAENRIIFTGMVEYEFMPHYYNAADILVHFSRHEGGPLSIIEAMACELPVICSDTGAAATFLKSNDVGCVIPVNDTGRLTSALGYVLETKHCPPIPHREAARERFDYRAICHKIHGAYQQLLT